MAPKHHVSKPGLREGGPQLHCEKPLRMSPQPELGLLSLRRCRGTQQALPGCCRRWKPHPAEPCWVGGCRMRSHSHTVNPAKPAPVCFPSTCCSTNIMSTCAIPASAADAGADADSAANGE